MLVSAALKSYIAGTKFKLSLLVTMTENSSGSSSWNPRDHLEMTGRGTKSFLVGGVYGKSER